MLGPQVRKSSYPLLHTKATMISAWHICSLIGVRIVSDSFFIKDFVFSSTILYVCFIIQVLHFSLDNQKRLLVDNES